MEFRNAQQQVFMLSLMSNLMKEYKGTQADLQAACETRLPVVIKEIPGWEIVWGPVVWKHEPENSNTGPDHVWFVARNPALPFADSQSYDTYVTSVAGSATTYNWVENNVRVNRVVDFADWIGKGLVKSPEPVIASSPASRYVAFGTALGVHRLVTVASPVSAASGNITLPEYWARFPRSDNTKVIFTGHSLGAALSPTLALGLFDSLALAKFSPPNLLVYPTAGPTPGNWQFAQHFQTTFPKVLGPRYEVWNCNIVNKLDIVSQAWCTSPEASPDQNMNNIPTLYGLPALPFVINSVRLAKFLPNASKTIYMPLEPLRFKGTPPLSTPKAWKEFRKVAVDQHIQAFLNLFGVYIPQILAEEEDGVKKMTPEEAARTEPILGDIALEVADEENGATFNEETNDENEEKDNPVEHKANEVLSGDFDMHD